MGIYRADYQPVLLIISQPTKYYNTKSKAALILSQKAALRLVYGNIKSTFI